ncbi:hypothetical protein RMATCC62417_01790 [Rhizopus microsporus]|nr:hypothetical protein RMATCC62417_01790 [Rhizopus microsporus]
MIPIARFLRFIKNLGPDQQPPCLKKITIDVSATEHAVITGVFDSAVSIQWCLFHVSRAWMNQIRKKVKLGSASANNAVHRSMIAALKSLMWESSTQMFIQKLLHFQQEFSIHADFMVHFTRKYLIDDKFMYWSAAYQPQMFTSMETNNYIESWHNQLKTNYLQRKLDHLIFILVGYVHADFMHNTARMAANIGRMSSKTREARKRMIAAEEITEKVCYIVKSFTAEFVYDISTEQGMMTACNCIDFQPNRRACKHMYLVYRFDKSYVVYSQSRLLR